MKEGKKKEKGPRIAEEEKKRVAKAIYEFMRMSEETGKTFTFLDILNYNLPEHERLPKTNSFPAIHWLKNNFGAIADSIINFSGGDYRAIGSTRKQSWIVEKGLRPISLMDIDWDTCISNLGSNLTNYIAKSSVFMPYGWLETHLKDLEKYRKLTPKLVCGDDSSGLLNIEKLTLLVDCLIKLERLKFKYQPFDMDEFEVVMDPEFIKEYNGRYFLFGRVLEGSPYDYEIYPFNFAIDRISGNIETLGTIFPIEKELNLQKNKLKVFYNKYFENIIGVTRLDCEKGKVHEVVIRTLNAKVHGQISTKKVHPSLEAEAFNQEKGYGVVKLKVEKSPELLTWLMSFGERIVVTKPVEIQNDLLAKMKRMEVAYQKLAEEEAKETESISATELHHNSQ